MGHHSIKVLMEQALQTRSKIAVLKTEATVMGNPVKRASHEQTISYLNRKLKAILDKIEDFGKEQPCILVTGEINVPVPGRAGKKDPVFVPKTFKMYLSGVTIDEAKVYFENIVKLKLKNLVDGTISFKELQLGVLLLNN